MYGFWCGLCQTADSAQKMGESYSFYLCLGCCFGPCIPNVLVRNKARQKYGLEGSTGKNHHISYFFYCVKYSYFKSQQLLTHVLQTETPLCTPTPWLTLLLVLGKSRVKQNSC
jgi:hypothetical protein